QRGPQAYSLLVSGAGGNSYCISVPSGTGGVLISRLEAGTLNYTASENCPSYTDLLSGRIEVRPGDALPFTHETGLCTDPDENVIKVYADWNNDGDFGDEDELVGQSAIMTEAGTFSGILSIPAWVSPGSFIRLRFVAVNTAAPEAVQPCGTYGLGETLDATVEIIQPARDLSVETFVGSKTPCPDSDNLVSVLLRNRGTEALEGFQLHAEIRENGTLLSMMEGTFEGRLLPGDTAVYTFPYYLTLMPSSSYLVVLKAEAPGDQVSSNNILETVLESREAGSPPTGLEALICEDGQQAVLLTSGSPTVYWYDRASGGSLIGAGDTVSTTFNGDSFTVYAAVNEFDCELGPPSKAALGPVTGTDAYHQYTPSVKITTQVPLVIESARMYTGNAGKIAFTVYDTRGVEIARSVQHLSASRNAPAPGPLPDDPLDTGRTYFLNLLIPEPGNYLISLDYEGSDATIFRNTTGPGYPIQIPGIMAITGTTASPAAADSYYYFYGIKVRAAGCPGPRVAVTATQPSPPRITQVGDTLQVDSRGTRLQWYLDGEVLEGAVTNRLHARLTGSYQVSARLGNCVLFSESYAFITLDDLIRELESNRIKVYPNPGLADREHPAFVEFYARASDEVELTVIAMQG